MALLKATRTAQYPQVAEFVFNFNDTMVDVNGVTKTFGSVFGDAGTFEVLPLPVGAVVVGGEVIVETAGAGPTAYTMNVGINGSATAFASAVDLKTAARTALTISAPLTSNSGQNVRVAITSTVANATAGKARVRVMYTIDNRAQEVVIV
jgi:hypothetical protein